jgi:lipid-A-disaccharide synthase
MANLVAGRPVVPELIQDDFVPERVADAALEILTDPAAASRMRAALRDVRSRLGTAGASRRAAQAILDVAHRERSSSG